jgi:hypothetical protein
MPIYQAKYKGQIVYGTLFLLGDSEWLLLGAKSVLKTGKEAISYDDLEWVKDVKRG